MENIEFKHSPGPWTITTIRTQDVSCEKPFTSTSAYIKDVTGSAIADVMGVGKSSGTKSWVDISYAIPNLHLICAAPDLLAALMGLISVCEENPSVPGQWWSKGVPTNEQLNKAKAAISKALNQQP